MLKYQLLVSELIHRKLSPKLIIRSVNSQNTIQKCIKLFNAEITWDGMFNLAEANRRIQYGDKIYTGYWGGDLFGYCWLKKLNETEYYIYNVFSKHTEYPRDYGATDMLYYVINTHTKGVVLADIDEWNIKSIRVFEKLGFKQL